MNADGTNRVELTTGTPSQGHNFNAAWSADGSKIAFVSDRNQHDDIFTMWSDGSHQMKITHNTSPANDQSSDLNPAWSPDGKKIIFERYDSALYGNTHHLFVVNADGSGLTDTSPATAAYQDDREPAWSPDGKTIACTCSNRIVLRNPDGSNPRQLTNEGHSPSWSPDGRQIAYIMPNAGSPAVWTMNRDGSNGKQLTSPSDFATPRWSPDGSLIVVAEVNLNQRSYRIDTVRPDGSHLTPITNFNDSVTGFQPDWQPLVSPHAPPTPVQSSAGGTSSGGAQKSLAPGSSSKHAAGGANLRQSPSPSAKGTSASASPGASGSPQAGAPFSGATSSQGPHHRNLAWVYLAAAGVAVAATGGFLVYFWRVR
jgi:Tol biopolymer transport system component